MNKLQIILTALVLCGFNHQESAQYHKFLSVLPELKLPLILRCGFDGPYFEENNVNPDILKPYLNTVGRHVAGKFKSKGKITPILYFTVGDILYPDLYTYNSDGKVIDSLYLHGSNCTDGEEGVGNANTIIDKDFNIIMQDSLFVPTGLEKKMKSVDSIFTIIKKYKMVPSGHFQKIYESKIRFSGTKVRWWD